MLRLLLVATLSLFVGTSAVQADEAAGTAVPGSSDGAASRPAAGAADRLLVVVASDDGLYEDPVRTRLEAGIRQRGLGVLPFGEAVVNAGVNPSEVLRCVDKGRECMSRAAALAAAGRVLVVSLRSDRQSEGGPRVVVAAWIFDVATGERLQGDQRFCEHCTSLEGLVALAGDLGDRLIAADEERRHPSAHLDIRTVPAGAHLWIDGKDVGPTGRPVAVFAGSHEVEVRLPGYLHQKRTIRVDAGAAEPMTWTLVPSGAPRTSRLWRVGKWAFLGTGVAATTLGVVWIAVDGPQTHGGPGGRPVREPEQRNTLVPGIVATTAGAALLGASAYLFYRELGASDEQPVATVAPSSHGAVAVWSGRF